ncbi:hypothetical protein [Peribacillus loiseleuriae]|uniref:hypothetical protein n=1 Tax=Peribacillus loiseleuriae TaxID=1679170 RepID=UPI0015D603EA|nr:hypothetical protein [Peribacillus loiseleuriae]
MHEYVNYGNKEANLFVMGGSEVYKQLLPFFDYKKMSKEELVNRLIAAEEYIVENNQKWLYKQFEDYSIES